LISGPKEFVAPRKAIVIEPSFRYFPFSAHPPMKISRLRRLTSTLALTSVAFTLIELLVVISIIAVLASLSIGAATGVQLAAKKASAKNDLSQIVNAVKTFYVDYGQYPSPSASAANPTDFCYGPSSISKGNTNDQLINVLRYPPTGMDGFNNTEAAENPRQIKYLEVPEVKNTAAPVSGILPQNIGSMPAGTWVDPWGQPYVVFIDGDYDGYITVNGVFKSGLSTTGTVAISAGAASIGLYTNKVGGSPSARAYNKTYDLLSWQ
jgi:prepilin-type N-terminal cleavage/methylation domain-containing protein